jgi:hypothetical protein
MSGFPLNKQLTDVGAVLAGPGKTAAVYRMYDLGPKPSLIRQPKGEQGFEIQLELWDIPMAKVGTFIQCAITSGMNKLKCATHVGTSHVVPSSIYQIAVTQLCHEYPCLCAPGQRQSAHSESIRGHVAGRA